MSTLLTGIVQGTMRRHVPFSVQVDLTMRCNEICVHCYRVVEDDRAELTTEEVKRLLGELAEAGTLYLTFSGGEVFLRTDLFEILEHARRLRFDVRLKSNAILITAEKARRLREIGVHQVSVSVYSADPAAHDAITKVPGSLARSIAGIERLVAAGVRARINCPVMASTVAGYRDVRALADRLGVPSGFDPMITAKNDGDTRTVKLRISPRQYARMLSDPILSPSPGPAAPATTRDDLDEPPCGASQNACYVSAYGDVMPCVALPLACGNIRERSFLDIWTSSPEMTRVRAIRVSDLHTCRGCEASGFCTRCPGQALVEDGDLYGPSSASCEQALATARFLGSPVRPASLYAH
jgi:radical SAM protein with 4Fe4S-binding SPASM domain